MGVNFWATVVEPVWQPVGSGLTTGWMFVYTMQPVVKRVRQPVWQPIVSCKRALSVMVSGDCDREKKSFQAGKHRRQLRGMRCTHLPIFNVGYTHWQIPALFNFCSLSCSHVSHEWHFTPPQRNVWDDTEAMLRERHQRVVITAGNHYTSVIFNVLKQNSIALTGSKLVADRFEAGRRPASNQLA